MAASPMAALAGKRILLIISGGIAAYKSLELIRSIRSVGGEVTPVMTAAAHQFITPMSAAALAESPVHTELFDLTSEASMGHIQLSRAADLVVVCPASADILAKMAAGMADDLATTLLLATDKPVLAAPAMNVRMWEHAATRANIEVLRQRGVLVVDPDVGAMACGEFGSGRLPDVPQLLDAIVTAFALPHQPLGGRHIIVTAGPTHEPIDPVRYIANRSSGRQGYAIAAALARLGARITLVSGPVHLQTPPGVSRIDVETAREMAAAVDAALPADAAVMVAAVADWAVDAPADTKIKKEGKGAPPLRFVENPDILATIAKPGPKRPRLVVGFAAETNDVITHAQGKLARKGCDLIVANDVSGDVMGGLRNQVHLVDADGVHTLSDAPKEEIARQLADHIASRLHS